MSDKTFLEYGEEYAARKGKRSEFVPPTKRHPHYRDLSPEQLNYYLWWRGQIRQGKIPKIDQNGRGTGQFNVPYLRLYFYELLNEIGTGSRAETYKRMCFAIENSAQILGFDWSGHGFMPGRIRSHYFEVCNRMRVWSTEYLLVKRASRKALLEHFKYIFHRGANDLPFGGYPIRHLLLARYPDLSPSDLSADVIAKIGYYDRHFRLKTVRAGEHDETAGAAFEKPVADAEVDRHIERLFDRIDQYYVSQSGKHLFAAAPHTIGEWLPFQTAIHERAQPTLEIWSHTDAERKRERQFFRSVLTALCTGIRAAHGLGGGGRSTVEAPVAGIVADYLHEELGLPWKRCDAICRRKPRAPRKAKQPARRAAATPRQDDSTLPERAVPTSVTSFFETDGAPLSYQCWADLLSLDKLPGEERVLLLRPLRPSGEISITQADWKRHFPGIKGFRVSEGDGVELVPSETADRTIQVPQSAIDTLGATPREALCITEKRDRFYLKRLGLEQRRTDVPGWMLFDRFDPTGVTRVYTRRPDLASITAQQLDELLGYLPRLKYHPLAPLAALDGRLGLIARRDLLGGLRKADQAALEAYKQAITKDQQSDGSWEGKTTSTAYALIKLAEVGATTRETAVARGVEWLLATTEPEGLPGLFGISEAWTQRYNTAKRRGQYFKPGRTSPGDATELAGYAEEVPTSAALLLAVADGLDGHGCRGPLAAGGARRPAGALRAEHPLRHRAWARCLLLAGGRCA